MSFITNLVSLLSRIGNWALTRGGSVEVTLSRRSAIRARQGSKTWQRNERWINALFRLFGQGDGHCIGVLLGDYDEAEALIELVDDLNEQGLL